MLKKQIKFIYFFKFKLYNVLLKKSIKLKFFCIIKSLRYILWLQNSFYYLKYVYLLVS